MSETSAERDGAHRGAIKSPVDFGGGVFLLIIAGVAYAGAFNLPAGHLSSIGSGMLPKALAVLIAAFGVVFIAQSFFSDGEGLERMAMRGPLFVLGSVVVFAATIRPWGLAIAGPLAVIVSALADKDTRPLEIALFAVVLTAGCVLLFKVLLRLPIPIFPPGYGPF
jgi:hypothetical protein